MSSVYGKWYKSGFGKLTITICLLLLGSSIGFYYLELRPEKGAGLFSALYWSIVTLTTVGYGDYVPATVGGRVLGILVMISGIGLVSTVTGNLASFMVERQERKRKGLLHVKLSGHVILLGWNDAAPDLIDTLKSTEVLAKSHLVLVNELPQDMRDELAFKLELEERLHFVFGRSTDRNVLSKAAPGTAKLVYVLSETGMEPKEADQQSINVALTLRNMAPQVTVYGEVMLRENRDNLLRAGVNEIVNRNRLSSSILGMMGAHPPVWPFFQKMAGMDGAMGLDYRTLTSEEKAMTWGELLVVARGKDGSLPLALCTQRKQLSLADVLDQGQALDNFILELFAASGKEANMGMQSPKVILNPPDDHKLEPFDGILYLKGQGGES